MPVAPAKKIADLQTEDPIAYALIQGFFQLFITRNGMAKELGLEAAMEGLEGLVDKGWARIIVDEDSGSMTVAAWRPDLQTWWMDGEAVDLDD